MNGRVLLVLIFMTSLFVVDGEDAVSASLLTVRDVSKLLQVSEREVQRLAARVPHYRVGRQLRFLEAEVLGTLREERSR